MEKKINKIYDEDLRLFPKYEDYLLDLERLDKYDFKGCCPEEIYNIFYDLAKMLPTTYTNLRKEIFNELTFFRERLNVNKEKEDISLIQTYANPPTVFCDENGRANLKYKSVFYCSDKLECSMFESKPKVGDEGFLSVWKGDAKRSLKVGVCLPNNLSEENSWNEIGENSFLYNESTLKEEGKDKQKHILELYKFISNKFINEKPPYYLTSMISDVLLFSSDLWRDFIVYPSFLKKTKMSNLAFHPNSVVENLSFNKVIRFKVTENSNQRLMFRLGQTGVLENNKIIWKERSEEETSLFEYNLVKK